MQDISDPNQCSGVPDTVQGRSEPKEQTTSSACGRFEKVRTMMTVEVVMLLYFIARSISNTATQQFIYARISEDKGFVKQGEDGEGCGSPNQTDEYKAMENEVQSEASNFMVLLGAVTLLPLMLVSLFFGHYSDHTGRRKAMLVSLAGATIRALTVVLISFYKANIYWLLLADFLDSFTGSVVVLQMACYAYIADISPEETRTLRLFLVDAGSGVGMIVGSLIAGYAIRDLDFTYTFVICIAFYVLNALYVIFYLKESVVSKSTATKLWNISHLKTSWNLFFKDRVHHNARKLRLCALFLMTFVMAQFGSSDVLTLYLLGEPLCFGSTQLGWFQTVSGLFSYFGGYISVKLLQRKVPNTRVLMLAAFAGAVGMILYGLAKSNVLIWIGALVTAFNILGPVLSRSMSSKIVHKDQQGAMFAALSFLQQFSNFLGVSTSDAIYAHTVKIHHGIVFFYCAGIFLLSVGVATILDFNRRRELRTSSGPEQATQSVDGGPDSSAVINGIGPKDGGNSQTSTAVDGVAIIGVAIADSKDIPTEKQHNTYL